MSQGPLFWTYPQAMDLEPYLDGRTFAALAGPESVTWSPSSGLIVKTTLAGTHVVQRPYTGAASPSLRQRYTFSASLLAVDEDDYRAINLAESRGAAVYWCPFVRTIETFNATSGSTYTLSRPDANGIVTGVTGSTHPYVILLAGVVSPGSGTVSGSTLTASATGVISVEYTPAFRVIVRTTHTAEEPNRLVVGLELEEVIEA